MIASWDHKIGGEKTLEGLLPARSYLLYSKNSDFEIVHTLTIGGTFACSNSWEFLHCDLKTCIARTQSACGDWHHACILRRRYIGPSADEQNKQ